MPDRRKCARKMQSNSSKSDYLVAGKSSQPLTGLSPSDPHEPAQTKWENIVSAAAPMEKESFDLILPRCAPSITANGFVARTYPAEFCSMFVNDYINTVERNHLYMEESADLLHLRVLLSLPERCALREAQGDN